MSKYPKKILRCFNDNIITTLIKALPFYLVYYNDFINIVAEKISKWNNEIFLEFILFIFFASSLFISLIFRKHLNDYTRKLLSVLSDLFISANQIVLGLLLYSYPIIIDSRHPAGTGSISVIYQYITLVLFTLVMIIVTTLSTWMKNNLITTQASEEHIQRLQFFIHRLASNSFNTILNVVSKTKNSRFFRFLS